MSIYYIVMWFENVSILTMYSLIQQRLLYMLLILSIYENVLILKNVFLIHIYAHVEYIYLLLQ